jgi:hypothetical protein
MAAVQKYGRDWFLVAADVSTRSNMECSAKVIGEVAAGRMQAVPGKRTYVQKQRQPLHAPAPAADRKSSTSKDNADDKDNEDRSNEMLPEGAATPASSSFSGSSAGSASGSSAG